MDRFRHPRALVALVVSGLAIAAIAAIAALALASPGEGDDGTFGVELRDGAVALEEPTATAGNRVVVEVTNGGTEEHEVVVVRTRRSPAAIPVGLNGVSPSLAGEVVLGEDHAAEGHDHDPDELLGLAPATSRRFQVDLAPGRYVVLCQTQNHYLEGEYAALQVR